MAIGRGWEKVVSGLASKSGETPWATEAKIIPRRTARRYSHKSSAAVGTVSSALAVRTNAAAPVRLPGIGPLCSGWWLGVHGDLLFKPGRFGEARPQFWRTGSRARQPPQSGVL